MFWKKKVQILPLTKIEMDYDNDIKFLNAMIDKVTNENLEVKIRVSLGRNSSVKYLSDEAIEKIVIDLTNTVEKFISDRYWLTLLKYFNSRDMISEYVASNFYFALIKLSDKVNARLLSKEAAT